MIDARLSHEVPSQVRRQRHRRQTPLRSKAVLPPRGPSGGQLQLRQARIPSWGLPLTDPVEPQLVLDGHRQQKLHSGLVRYCISKAPTSRDLFGQIAALAHLAWHGVILVTRFYTMCLFSCHSACRPTYLSVSAAKPVESFAVTVSRAERSVDSPHV